MCWRQGAIGKRAKRAIYRVARNATRSRGSPRSFAAQSARARDDIGFVAPIGRLGV